MNFKEGKRVLVTGWGASTNVKRDVQGGFQLVDLNIRELKNDLLRSRGLSLVENLLFKKILYKICSSLNAVIATDERH